MNYKFWKRDEESEKYRYISDSEAQNKRFQSGLTLSILSLQHLAAVTLKIQG